MEIGLQIILVPQLKKKNICNCKLKKYTFYSILVGRYKLAISKSARSVPVGIGPSPPPPLKELEKGKRGALASDLRYMMGCRIE